MNAEVYRWQASQGLANRRQSLETSLALTVACTDFTGTLSASANVFSQLYKVVEAWLGSFFNSEELASM